MPDGSGGLDTVTISVPRLDDSLQANFGQDTFRTGLLRDYQLNVSGGSEALRFFVGGHHEVDEGVERANSLRRTAIRANVTVTPGGSWDVQSSMGYTTGRTFLPLESGGGGATWATDFASPSFLHAGTKPGNPQLGFRSGPPDVYYDAHTIFQDADRFTGSLTFNHRPFGWLDHRLIVGVDRLAEDNQEQAPRNDPLAARYASFSSVGGTTRGYLPVATGVEARLVLAEARGGAEGAAIIDALRARAGVGLPALTAAERAGFTATPFEERRRELWRRGTRWYDIWRGDLALVSAAGVPYPTGGSYGDHRRWPLPDVELLSRCL